MSAAETLQQAMDRALAHPEGAHIAASYDRTFQFELEEGDRFYLELFGGKAAVKPGDCGLDWKRADWERVTCIRTSRQTLEDILTGRRLVTEAYFDREFGFAPHRAATRHVAASAVMGWLYTLIRLAGEQAKRGGAA